MKSFPTWIFVCLFTTVPAAFIKQDKSEFEKFNFARNVVVTRSAAKPTIPVEIEEKAEIPTIDISKEMKQIFP
jgi:hypothetical protein